MPVAARADGGAILFVEVLVVYTVLEDAIGAVNVVLVFPKVHADDRAVGFIFLDRFLFLGWGAVFDRHLRSHVLDGFGKVGFVILNLIVAGLDASVEVIRVVLDPVQIDPPLMQVG